MIRLRRVAHFIPPAPALPILAGVAPVPQCMPAIVPSLAARISQVGKVRAGVKPLGPHQFFPSDQSHPATLAIRLLRTPHSAIALAFWRPARLSGTPIAGRNALPIGTMAKQVLDADTLEAVFKE